MSKRPNLVLLFADQMHKYALGKVDAQFHTPHLDRLCEEGVLFENAYSSNPICGPYRGCLMTGLYASRSGVLFNGDPLPAKSPLLAASLTRAGYASGFVGKWHLGSNRDEPIPPGMQGGFQRFMGYQCHNGFDPAPPYRNRVAFYDERGREHVYREHRTQVTTDLALQMLDRLVRESKPFFAVVGYQAPHYPLQPAPAYENLYRDTVFAKTPDYQPVEPYTPTFSPPSPRPFSTCPDYRRYGGDMDAYMRLYAGMISQVDAGVGRIVDALKRLGVYENTLLVFTSDHGDMQGSHGCKNKCLPYEKSCGTPLIARLPGGRRNQRSAAPVSTVDFFPTFLQAAGVQPDFPLDGRSFYAHLRDGSPFPRDYTVAEHRSRNQTVPSWRMIRRGRYKLTVDYESFAPWMLFDLEQDPFELQNLAGRPDMRETVVRLTEALKSVLQRQR